MNTQFNCVGIDISKGKSTVSILRPMGETVKAPFEIQHTHHDLDSLVSLIKNLDGDTRIVLESTGKYHRPVLNHLVNEGFFVSEVNPKLIKDYGNAGNSLRRVKSDSKDSVRIAQFGIDKWFDLRRYEAIDESRDQLKTLNRQYLFYTQQKAAMINNLISILDQTFPGINNLFSNYETPEGKLKWVVFVSVFWHAECVSKKSLKAFTDQYIRWCRSNGYQTSIQKAKEIHEYSRQVLVSLQKNDFSKNLVRQAVDQLNNARRTAASIKASMSELASILPEYQVVMDMYGVGPALGPQLMAEIGDIRRFHSKGALTAFAGVDPGVNQSGSYDQKSVHASKKGSPCLRRTLFLIVSSILLTAPEDDPVYQFMDRKRREGKPFRVYMIAAANKFLRLYYGKVNSFLKARESLGVMIKPAN